MKIPPILQTIVRGALPLAALTVVSSPAYAIRLWSDPATWGGTVPGPTTDAVITGTDPVVLNVTSATVNTLTVSGSSTLRFSTTTSGTLFSKGNVVVEGTLEMKPASASVNHTLKITEADESAFVGGGMSVLATDKGLWVMEAGKLDILGTAKTPWIRAAGSIASGTNVVTLASAPTGWQVNDEISITPTSSATSSAVEFDLRTITSISGSTITLNSPTTYAHPSVAVSGSQTLTAEVLNLTRNVRIEGMPPAAEKPRVGGVVNNPGRSHIFIHNMTDVAVHSIKNAAIRYMGPRKATAGGDSVKVGGRYGLHLHHSGSNNAGSVIEGVVVRDTGAHAFVPHVAHNVTFTKCISYNTYDHAYWWDPQGNDPTAANATTNGVTYDGCVAAIVKSDRPYENNVLSGFLLGIGANTSIVNSVATGVQGNVNAAGYQWPADANGQAHNVWVFNNNVAHNNLINGAFIWQNDMRHHVIENFISYRNNGKGVEHGAYKNTYLWKNNRLIGNGTGAYAPVNTGSRAAWLNHNGTWDTTSGVEGRYTVRDMYVDGENKSPYAFTQTKTAAVAPASSLMLRWTVKNYITKAISINQIANGSTTFQLDFVDWTVGTSGELEPSDFQLTLMQANSKIRVQRRNGTAYQITPQAGSTTTFDIVTIPAFYPY